MPDNAPSCSEISICAQGSRISSLANAPGYCLRENSDLLSAALELIATRHRVIDGKGNDERAPNAKGAWVGYHPPVLLHAGKSGPCRDAVNAHDTTQNP